MRTEPDPSYTFASGVFGRERTYCLKDDALHWDGANGQSGSLAYADVDAVHVFCVYQPYGSSTQVCVLRSRSGAKCVLKSKNFRAWGRNSDRTGTYVPFVRDLWSRVAAAAPQSQFFAGLPRGWYVSQLIALILCLLIIVAAIVPTLPIGRTGASSDSGGAISTLLVTLTVFIFPALGVWKTLVRGKPRLLASRQLPDDLVGLALAPQP